MTILKFNISGELGCFKKATTFDKSTEFILTYEIMPVTVLKGIIGAVLGYSGLAEAYRNKTDPEYMTKLKGVGVGIKPIKLGEKFTQQITNTTGFANKGMTNIVKQELLNDISYDIYVTGDFDDFDLLYQKLLSNQTTFPVVLGRKGFNASFSNIELIEATISNSFEGRLLSICDYEKVKEKRPSFYSTEKVTYKYVMDLPIDYNDIMMYRFKKIYYSDTKISYTGEVISVESVAIFR